MEELNNLSILLKELGFKVHLHRKGIEYTNNCLCLWDDYLDEYFLFLHHTKKDTFYIVNKDEEKTEILNYKNTFEYMKSFKNRIGTHVI